MAALAQDPESGAVKSQIGTVLSRVIDADYPGDWPGLVDEIVVLLRGGEGEIEAGLRATVEVLRGFRYVGLFSAGKGKLTRHLGSYNRSTDRAAPSLPTLITHLFPTLLTLAQRILATTPTDTASTTLQGTLLHLVLKSYKHSIATHLSADLQAPDSIVAWGTLFLSIIQRSIPVELLPSDLDAREKHAWSKTKKWALYSLNRLFMRYGNPSQLPSNMKVLYGPFAERFIAQFVPEILKAYFGLVERSVGGEWSSSKTKHHLLVFFEEWCVSCRVDRKETS